jgi:hypothetical protein
VLESISLEAGQLLLIERAVHRVENIAGIGCALIGAGAVDLIFSLLRCLGIRNIDSLY